MALIVLTGGGEWRRPFTHMIIDDDSIGGGVWRRSLTHKAFDDGDIGGGHR